MKKLMSKAMILTMVAALAIGATACSTTKNNTVENVTTESKAEVANPVHESSQEEIHDEFGINLQAPEGASDVKYSIIDSDDNKIAQMDFVLDGKPMCLRAKYTTITNINEAANVEEGEGSANISGLYYDWSYIGVDQIYDYPAVLRISNEKAGYIGWLDVVPGILYNLSMTQYATPEDLAKYANMAFVPYDGEETANVVEGQLTDCFEKIYNAKAGTPGSEERVTAAAKAMNDFISTNDEEIYSLERAIEVTETAFDSLKESYPEENFNDNFKESFDAVVENIKENNPNLPEMESYKCILRAVELHMEDAKQAYEAFIQEEKKDGNKDEIYAAITTTSGDGSEVLLIADDIIKGNNQATEAGIYAFSDGQVVKICDIESTSSAYPIGSIEGKYLVTGSHHSLKRYLISDYTAHVEDVEGIAMENANYKMTTYTVANDEMSNIEEKDISTKEGDEFTTAIYDAWQPVEFTKY